MAVTTKVADGDYIATFIDPALRETLDALARKNGRSRSAELRLAVSKHLRDSARTDQVARSLVGALLGGQVGQTEAECLVRETA